eukprot:PhM_4_TR4145/c1_g1_i2/m.22050
MRQNKRSVHRGSWAITLDFMAWFDQCLLDTRERPYHCFPYKGKWYRLTRLPMGQRQAVDVAHTVTELIASFPLPEGVFIDVYIDNIRFQSDRVDALVEAALTFVQRCRHVGATINEVPSDADAPATLRDLVHEQGEFLGAEYSYKDKAVRVGAKAMAKLRVMNAVVRGAGCTNRNMITLFGLLFFTLQVTGGFDARWYHAMREYSDIARKVQASSNPC